MRIHIRQCDDWIAVYKNGEKVWDTHSCPLNEGLEALGIPFVYEDLYDDMNYETGLLVNGDDPFPDHLCDEELFIVPEGIHVERVR